MQLKGIAKPMQTWQVIDAYQNTQTYNRRWMEFEMDGFNLQLDIANMSNNTKKEWFETWFNSKYYHILYQHRNDHEAAEFIDALVRHVEMVDDAKPARPAMF